MGYQKNNVSRIVSGFIRKEIGERGKLGKHFNLSNDQLKYLSDQIAAEVIMQIKRHYDSHRKWEWITKGNCYILFVIHSSLFV